MNRAMGLVFCVIALAVLGAGAVAYKYWPAHGGSVSATMPGEPASDKSVEVIDLKPLKPGEAVELPFIFWGGDVATFHANGGLETKPDSLYGKHGLNIKLTPGDDFDKQVDNYLEGKSPFLRGTLSMLGQASDKLTAKPETTPVVFLQMTWSAGDHLVGRAAFKNLKDQSLKGKKIALQEGGPHVGMLNDILRSTDLTWKDITVVWTKDVSGPKGPAELFRKDNSVDACFAISPEMFVLTSAPESGGVDSVGDGSKDSVRGAHVVVSTQHLSRSIADVYACRKDFFEKNRPIVERIVAGYLKATEELVDAKKKGAGDKAANERYQADIKLAQDIWGKDAALKDAVAKAEDVDGLISDAVFVGLPGNESFFKAKGNLSGFAFKQSQALVLAADPAKDAFKEYPKPFKGPDLNYGDIRKLGDLHGKVPGQARFTNIEVKGGEADQEIYSFVIKFQPDQDKFPEAEYGAKFQRVLELASLFGNCMLVSSGHADPSANMVPHFVMAAKTAGILKVEDGSYTFEGKKVDLTNTKEVLAILAKNPNLTSTESGEKIRIQDSVNALQKLSDKRAEGVRKSVVDYALHKNLILEQSQMKAHGYGVTESIGYPPGEETGEKNRRVEFKLMKVPAKDVNTDEFDL